jgi:transcriptional regulator with XRE-family HTH domain
MQKNLHGAKATVGVGAESAGALLHRIGATIREARRARGMTLRALSEKSGLSEAFLSRLERGEASTSIANLIRITGIIEIGLADLFDARGGGRGYVVGRAADRQSPREIAATGYRYQPLVAGWPGQRLDAFILTFPRRNRADVMTAHEGEELVYVLQGQILFQLGDEAIPLGVGDCIYFKAETPHMGKNVGDVDAKVLMVTTPGRGPGREFGWWKTPRPRGARRHRSR